MRQAGHKPGGKKEDMKMQVMRSVMTSVFAPLCGLWTSPHGGRLHLQPAGLRKSGRSIRR